MSVFRRPHDYRPSLGVVAVLFPVVAAPPPPLRQPISQQIVSAAYRQDFPWPVRPPFPTQLFQTPQAPPLALPIQQMAAAAYRAPIFQTGTNPGIPDLLDLAEVDAGVGQRDQQLAWAAFREPQVYPVRPPLSEYLLEAIIAAFPFPAASQDANIAYREAPPPPQQRIPLPQTINIPPDSPPLQSMATPLAWAAYRDPNFSQRVPAPTAGPLFTLPQAPPLTPVAQQLAWAAYRDYSYPGPTPRATFAPWLSALIDSPPLIAQGARLAYVGYREGYPNPAPRAPYPPPLLLPPDSPPLASMAQMLAQRAWRPDYSPARGGVPPFNVFDPVVVDNPPFRNLSQQLTWAAYRGELWPTWAIAQEAMRIDAALAVLFPPAPAPTPSPVTAVGNIAALTARDVLQLKKDVAYLRDRLEYLISLLEKRGLKT